MVKKAGKKRSTALWDAPRSAIGSGEPKRETCKNNKLSHHENILFRQIVPRQYDGYTNE